jgi:hypothetical protein
MSTDLSVQPNMFWTTGMNIMPLDVKQTFNFLQSIIIATHPNRYLWADCLENVETSASHNPMVLHGLLQGQLYLFLHISLNWLAITLKIFRSPPYNIALDWMYASKFCSSIPLQYEYHATRHSPIFCCCYKYVSLYVARISGKTSEPLTTNSNPSF